MDVGEQNSEGGCERKLFLFYKYLLMILVYVLFIDLEFKKKCKKQKKKNEKSHKKTNIFNNYSKRARWI